MLSNEMEFFFFGRYESGQIRQTDHIHILISRVTK